jgi:hypothetical protein
MSSVTDGKSFSNISATTSAFVLKGGQYSIIAHATSFGSKVQFETLAGDSSTWLAVGSNFAADGVQTVYGGAGQYRFELTSASGVYISVAGVPA